MNKILLLLFLQGFVCTMASTASKTLRIKPTPSPPAGEPEKSGISTLYQVEILAVSGEEGVDTEAIDAGTFSFAEISTIEFIPYYSETTPIEEGEPAENIVYIFDNNTAVSTNEKLFSGQVRGGIIGECTILYNGDGMFIGSLNASGITHSLSSQDGTYWISATDMNDFPDD
mmetsp:Transcript_5443/g.8057  ORF Transcript_5443/g.8057 Transcript_5443/m.8057 type:complete len:172 (-) Transcript_5443:291-806(-)